MEIKNKKVVFITILIGLAAMWFVWNFMIPSQDLKKNIKDMRADAAGLKRKISCSLFNGSVKTWECKTKIYPFPTEGGSGAGFSFINNDGKKIICGPGWIIEEQ